MVKGSFRLERVLSYRCEMEKLRRQEFADAKRAFEHADDLLRRDQAQLGSIAREFNERHTEMATIEEVRMYADYFARKREEIKLQQERVEELDVEMSLRRDDLVDATKEKKVLESLKEKNSQEFRSDMSRKEQSFLDEISVQKKGGSP